MPELPEVETIVRGLEQNIINETIISAKFSNKQLRAPYPSLDLIINTKIQKVFRRAKYILLQLNNNHHLIVHLGMSGRLLVGTNLMKKKHDHAILTLGSSKQLVLNDPRRFGLVTVIHKDNLNTAKLFKDLGIEPLSKDFTAQSFYKITKRSRAPIKSILMNANHVVGVGNIYASESLFRAKIHPLRPSNSIKLSELEELIPAIQSVLDDAIKAGGSTLKDYVHSNGDVGYFQHYFKVYGKKGKDCPICQSMIEATQIAGRSTFFCPKCQK